MWQYGMFELLGGYCGRVTQALTTSCEQSLQSDFSICSATGDSKVCKRGSLHFEWGADTVYSLDIDACRAEGLCAKV